MPAPKDRLVRHDGTGWTFAVSGNNLAGGVPVLVVSVRCMPNEIPRPYPPLISFVISARCKFIASVLQAGKTSAVPLPFWG